MLLEEILYLQGLGIALEIGELESPWPSEKFDIRK